MADEDLRAALAAHRQCVDALAARAVAEGQSPVVIVTSISTVLLVGAFAYKLRRPVRLDFLDFSTLEQRRQDCEAELALNRRTAAHLYVAVVPVLGPASAPRFGAPSEQGDIVDWALQMRRFDPSACFDQLAHQHRLSSHQASALGEHLGRFHQSLPPSPPGCGAPAQAHAWAQANFDTLCAHPLARPWHPRLQALQRWTAACFAALEPRMARRLADGWVREGHGDLHLGNLLWEDGRAVAFDAVEFNPALRHGDVIGDFAFTWMDLHRHGLPALAALCLNAYVETLGDPGGLPMLRWYAVYRALVRAKVGLLRAAQAETLGEPVQPHLKAMAHDIGIAEQLSAGRGPPVLIATTGLSGSGKSTAAARLAAHLGALRWRSDVERKRLFGLAPLAPGGAALYQPEATARTYDRLEALATDTLRAGWPVVVDAANLKRAERDRWRALAARENADFVLLSCELPPAQLRERLQQRAAAGQDPSDADVSVLERQQQWHEPVQADERPCRLWLGA